MQKYQIDVFDISEFDLLDSFELHAKTKSDAETMGLGVIEYKYGNRCWNMCIKAKEV